MYQSNKAEYEKKVLRIDPELTDSLPSGQKNLMNPAHQH